jgi:RNA polymerase sigma factor (TIGR02999 family)
VGFRISSARRPSIRDTFFGLPTSFLLCYSSGVSEITRILGRAQQGDSHAAEELLPLIYDELRRLAAHKMANEVPGQTLQPTALVHEAWLRLSQQTDARWQNREQFYAMAAEVMRRILVDRARRRQARKHGGDLERVELDAVELPGASDDAVVLQVHEALEKLAAEDAEKAEVVKLRFFVGLENAEIAAILRVSEKTVQRHWSFAKAWLYRAMKDER